MFDKSLIGAIAAIIGIIGFAPYYWSLYKRKTKPHLFSWIPWTITSSIAFAAQIIGGGGAGAWATGASAFLSSGILIFAVFYGEQHITKKDHFFFWPALLTIPLWAITDDPLLSVVLATLINAWAYFPTIRKAWSNPHEENGSMYGVLVLRDILSIIALSNYSVITLIFPAMRFIFNLATSAIVYGRRHIHPNTSQPPAL